MAEMVNLIIDGKPVTVPKGTNIIDAAKSIGIDIPYYCYHPHLSIAGNCRMCQIRVKGAPKLDIACNTLVREGMEVTTHETSKEVEDAQAATLEFILINHPLDCTVCDQAGHCKLQDYHYDYNARPSRFLEHKEHKVKAEPLGPTVMLDGERCIMCTRCIRFCDEITQTSELGMLNRGDRSVIAINPERELNNPLSGSVVDLCPVGALTHKHWRFNTRIWFTQETDSICTGCSTGCNAKVAVRDGQVVQVKARLNSQVNKEWLCDEGRYGFQRFLPEQRLRVPLMSGKQAGWEAALKEAKKLGSSETIVFLSPDLLLEEYFLAKEFLTKNFKQFTAVIAYKERKLSEVEAILISPDYACNFRGMEFSGLLKGDLEGGYKAALKKVETGSAQQILMIGERAIAAEDQTDALIAGLSKATLSILMTSNANSKLTAASKVVFPGRSILEKSGLLINRAERLQYAAQVIDFPDGSEPEWRIINRLAGEFGSKLSSAVTDRDLTLWLLAKEPRFAGLRIADIKAGGICLKTYAPTSAQSSQGATTKGSEEARA